MFNVTPSKFLYCIHQGGNEIWPTTSINLDVELSFLTVTSRGVAGGYQLLARKYRLRIEAEAFPRKAMRATCMTTLRHTPTAAICTFTAVRTSDISLDLEYFGNETHPTEGEYLPCRLEPGLDRSLFLARRAGEDWWERDSGLTITALGLAGDGSCRGSLPGTTPVQLKRHNNL